MTDPSRETDSPPARPAARGGVWVYLSGVALVAAALVGLAVLSRTRRSAAEGEHATRAAELAAGPPVAVAVVATSRPERALRLLGEARPFYETTLYGKVAGYLRQIRVDRGDRVRAGELLAVVEAPETEQQYRSALATASNRRAVATRDRQLVAPGVISQAEAELAETSEREAAAQVGVVAAQRGYRELRAPFAGVVTARYADPGALVQSATGSQSGALPIVRVSVVDRLRVFTYLEQRDATLVRVGADAEVRLEERPEVRVAAHVSRLAGELDAHTRTLLTEIDVPNADGRITPGSYVQVAMRLAAPVYPEVPTEALVMRGTHPFVAVVGGDDRVAWRAVELVDDDGVHARILAGVRAGERVALNLGDSLPEGARVQPVASAVRSGP